MATPSPAIPAYDPGLFRSRVDVFHYVHGPPGPHSAGQPTTGEVNVANATPAYLAPMDGRDVANARQLHPTTTGRAILRYTDRLAVLVPGDKLRVAGKGAARELFVTWRYRELEQGSGGYLVLDYEEPIRQPPA